MSNFWEAAPLANNQPQPNQGQPPAAPAGGNFWEGAPLDNGQPTEEEKARARATQQFSDQLTRINTQDIVRGAQAGADQLGNPLPTAWDKAEAVYEGAARGVIPAVAGLAGSGAALGLASRGLAMIPHPLAKLAAGGLLAAGGGLGAGIGAANVQESFNPLDERQRELASNPETSPYFTVGSYIPGAATMGYGLGNIRGIGQGIQALRTGAPMPAAATEAAVNIGTNIPVALGANYVSNQGQISGGQAIGDVLLGTFGTRPNVVGAVPFNTGFALGAKGGNFAARLNPVRANQPQPGQQPPPAATQPQPQPTQPTPAPAAAAGAGGELPPWRRRRFWEGLSDEGKARATAEWNARQAAAEAQATPTPSPEAQAPVPTQAEAQPTPVAETPATPQPEATAPVPEPQRPATVKPQDWDGLNLETKRLLAEEARINAEQQVPAPKPAPEPLPAPEPATASPAGRSTLDDAVRFHSETDATNARITEAHTVTPEVLSKPVRVYRGVAAGREGAPSQNAMHGKGYYYSFEPQTAGRYAENRGSGSSIEFGTVNLSGKKLLNLEALDRSSPEFKRLIQSLGLSDDAGSIQIYNAIKDKFPSAEVNSFPANRLGEVARAAGYDGIVSNVGESGDIPAHSQLMLFERPSLARTGEAASVPAPKTQQTEIPGAQDGFNLAPENTRAPAPEPAPDTTPDLVQPTEPAYVGPARKRLADLEAQGKGETPEAAGLREVIRASAPKPAATPEPPPAKPAPKPAPAAETAAQKPVETKPAPSSVDKDGANLWHFGDKFTIKQSDDEFSVHNTFNGRPGTADTRRGTFKSYEDALAFVRKRMGLDAEPDKPAGATSAPPSQPEPAPVNRRAEGGKKAWETRRQRGQRTERNYGRSFDETNETPQGDRVAEPDDIVRARQEIVAAGRKGTRPSRDLINKVEQYEAERRIELGRMEDSDLAIASDDALNEYITRVTADEEYVGELSAEQIRNRERASKELERRSSDMAKEEGRGETKSTGRSVVNALLDAVRATGKKLPLFPKEFGYDEWRALYEELPPEVRDEVFNDFRGQLDLKRMRDPALGPSYRADVRTRASKEIASIFETLNEAGLDSFNLSKNNTDAGYQALRQAAGEYGAPAVGPVKRLYTPRSQSVGGEPFSAIPAYSLTDAGASMVDLAQIGATAVLADSRVLPGMNPIVSNMHLLAEGREIGMLFAGEGQRSVASPSMKSVAEMFAIRDGNRPEGSGETFYDQRDAQRRILGGKLNDAFSPVAASMDGMTPAEIAAMDGRLARMLSGEMPINASTPEGQVALKLKALADEAFNYAKEAGLDIKYTQDYGMPHSINVAAVDANQAAFLAAATRAYAVNNPRRIAFLQKKLAALNKNGQGNSEEAVQMNLEIAELSAASPSKQAEAWLDNILLGAEGADHSMGLMLDGTPASNSADFLKGRVFAAEARAIMRDFYNNDTRLAWDGYIKRITTMAEFARRFGPKGEKWLAMVDGMRQDGASELQIQAFRDHVKDALGTLNPRPTPEHALANALLGLSNMAKLKTTFLANFLEPMAAATRGDLTTAVSAPIGMARNTARLLAEMTPGEARLFADTIGREANQAGGEVALARAAGLIDAAGSTEILNNSGHTIDSNADYQGGGKAGRASRAINRGTNNLANALGLAVTESAKRVTTAHLAANRIDGFIDGLINDSILARAYRVAKPNATDNPFSVRGESRMRIRRAGIGDDQADAFAYAWEKARKSGDFTKWLMSSDPMAELARKAIRMESSQAMVNSNRGFNTGGAKGKWISQDNFFGKAMMTFLRYPAAAKEQIFGQLFKDVKTGVRGYDNDIKLSEYSRFRMVGQALAVPVMMGAASGYLLLRDIINNYDDKSFLKRVIEGYSYTGAAGGKAELVNKLLRGEIPPVINEIVKTMQNISRAERGQGERVLVSDTTKYFAQPAMMGALAALPPPLASLAVRLAGSKQAREEVVEETMGPKEKPGKKPRGF